MGLDPDMPAIGSIAVGENWANVSWRPARREPPTNPGARFYVEYVKASDAGPPLLHFIYLLLSPRKRGIMESPALVCLSVCHHDN